MNKSWCLISEILISIYLFSTMSCQNDLSAKSKFYVNNDGNDKDDGKTPETAWQTIAKVNSTNLTAGDSIFFKAGGVWREMLKAKSGSKDNTIYYGRYGKGANPLILGSEVTNKWFTTGITNIWKSSGKFNNPQSGRESEIFFIKDDSTSWGIYQKYTTNFSNLTKEFDWSWNNNNIYIYAPNDPNIRYDSIEIPQRDQAISATNNLSSYIEFNGIDLVYCKVRGFYSGYPEVYNQTDLTFRNMRIAYIGEKNGAASYGISVFHSNLLVEKCQFSDVGRRPVSINFYTKRPAGEEIYLQNIVIRNNKFKRGYHTSSLDLAAESVCTGDTVMNVFFYNNIVDDHELTWTGNDFGSNQFYIQEGDGTKDIDDAGAYFNRIFCFNNVFIQSTRRNILVTDADSVFVWNNTIVGHNLNIDDSPYGNVVINAYAIDFRNNILLSNWINSEAGNNYGMLNEDQTAKFVHRDYNLYYQQEENLADNCFNGGIFGYYTISEWSKYQADNPNFDQNSPKPKDPDFNNLNNFDFRLKETSPARAAGIPLSLVSTDIFGIQRDLLNPSIGAIEYQIPTMTEKINSQEGTKELKLTFFPNPSYDKVTFSITGRPVSKEYYIQLFDISGKLVFKSDSYSQKSVTIPIMDLLPGLYLVDVVFEGTATVTGKLLVNR